MEQKTQENPKLRTTPEVAAAVLADRCRKDGAFARKLQDDPRGTLAELNGQKVPEYMNVAVHQNAPDHWHIVIPSQKQAQRLNEAYKTMDAAGGTLSDEQLEALSGGEIVVILSLIGIVGTATAVATAATAGIVAGAITAA